MTQQTEEMSENIQNVQFTFTETERERWAEFKLFKDGAGLTDEQIASEWNLKTTKQVQRLKAKAKQNGSYKEWKDDKLNWIQEDFKELHAKMKKKFPKLAYFAIAKMYAKTIPTVTESLNYSKGDLTITNNRNFNLTRFSEEDKVAILDAYRRLNKNSSSTLESPSLH